MSTYAEMMGRTSDGEQPMHFLGAHASMRLQGNLLECQLRQCFVNPHKTNVEITYTCPLPFGAVLLAVEVKLNDKVLHGEVKERKAAREQYEASIEKGDSAVLVSLNSDGSLSMELGNLLAGETCEITLCYAQVLQVSQGSLRVMLPTAIAPRYGDAITDGGFEPHSAPYSSLSVEYPFTFEIRVEGELARAKIASPSHPLAMRLLDGAVVLTLAAQAWLDHDLVVQLEDLPAGGIAVVAVDALEPDESVVLACLTPHVEHSVQRPANVQVLVDCSGSMVGESIACARLALQQIVGQMQVTDQFSLSRFGNSVEHCHRRLVAVTAMQKELAADWIRELDANMGGTEMEKAIVSTLKLARDERSDLLLVTDGEIHAIDSLLSSLRAGKHRCFIVGIGASPAESHLRRLAEVSGGACEFVAPGEAAQQAIERMFARLRSARISQLSLRWPESVQVMGVESLPDYAFLGDQIQATVRIQGAWPQGARLQLRALRDDASAPDAEVMADCEPTYSALEAGRNTLARMGTQALLTRWQREQDRSEEPDAKMIALAVRYQLITQHTHFVLSHERGADEAAVESPRLLTTPQMAHAGLRSGMSVPSVWRASRSVAGARVGALSSGGLDELALPAFLRKSAETVRFYRHTESSPSSLAEDLTPRELALALIAQPSQVDLQTLAQLKSLGLPERIADLLEYELIIDESTLVQALVRWLILCEQAQWQIDDAMKAQAKQWQLRDWVLHLSADHWPDSQLVDPLARVLRSYP